MSPDFKWCEKRWHIKKCPIHSDCPLTDAGHCGVYGYCLNKLHFHNNLTYCPQYDRIIGKRNDRPRVRIRILAVIKHDSQEDICDRLDRRAQGDGEEIVSQ